MTQDMPYTVPALADQKQWEQVPLATKRFFRRVVDHIKTPFVPDVVLPGDIMHTEQWRNAKAFQVTALPEDGVDYEWVWAYAKESIERALRIYADLDDKANEIIKYLGGGAGVLTAASLLTIKKENTWIYMLLLPSLISSLIAVFFAVTARLPRVLYLPPGIDTAFKLANIFQAGDRSKAALIGHMHLTCESLYMGIDTKAARVLYATWWFFSALVMLMVAMIAVGIRMCLS